MAKKIKSIFISGLIVVIGLGICYKIIVFIIDITRPLKELFEVWFSWNFPGLEILVAVAVIFIIGYLINIGKGKLLEKGERIPGLRMVKAVRENTEKLLREGKIVKIPLFGPISVIGFTSENALEEDKDEIFVFVPNSPMLFTGWVVLVPKDRIKPLSGSLQEFITLLVSGGLFSK